MKKKLALSVKQPFAWLIVHGYKNVENRSWDPPDDIIGKRIYIHAGQTKISKVIMEVILKWRLPGMPLDKNDYDYGAIVGSVVITGSTTKSKSRWATKGSVHWKLSQAKTMKPIKCKGQLKLFDVTKVFKK